MSNWEGIWVAKLGGTVRVHLLLKSGSTIRFREVIVLSSCPKDSRGCFPIPLVFHGNNGSVPGFPRQIANSMVRLNDIQHMASQQPTNNNTHSWCILEYFISQSRHPLQPKQKHVVLHKRISGMTYAL